MVAEKGKIKDTPESLLIMKWFNSLTDGDEFTVQIIIRKLKVQTPNAYRTAQFIVDIGAAVCEHRAGMRVRTYMKICDLPEDAYEQYLEIQAEDRRRYINKARKGKKRSRSYKHAKKSSRVTSRMKETGKLASEITSENFNFDDEITDPLKSKTPEFVHIEFNSFVQMRKAMRMMRDRIKELEDKLAGLESRPTSKQLNLTTLISDLVPDDIAKSVGMKE